MSKSCSLKRLENRLKVKWLSAKCYEIAIGLYRGLLELNGMTSNSFLQGRMFRRLQELKQLCEELDLEVSSQMEPPTTRTSKRSGSPGGRRK